MTEQPSESIMKRIKSLLSMAEHASSNENEAAIAMEKAQALLLQYNLSMSSVKTDVKNIDESIQKFDIHAEHGFVWKARLLNTIAKSNLCFVLTNSRSDTIYVFGKKTNVETVIEMFVWVKEQLESIALRKFSLYKFSGGNEHGKTWNTSFYYGANQVIYGRLNKSFEIFSQGNGYALVLANDKAIQKAVHEIFPSVNKPVKRKINLSYDGYISGTNAGNDIKFSREKQLNNNCFALGSGK